jgi:hypothetical protein
MQKVRRLSILCKSKGRSRQKSEKMNWTACWAPEFGSNVGILLWQVGDVTGLSLIRQKADEIKNLLVLVDWPN